MQNDAFRQERLSAYDQVIKEAEIYKAKDSGLPRGWTEVMAKTVSQPPHAGDRLILKQILIERGFKME